MSNVIEFKKPEQKDPHGSGEAFCLSCKHEWVAVAPAGETQLECPKCHTMKGLWKYPFAPADGDFMWKCNCGNNLFYLTPQGHLCANCGILQQYN